MIQRRHRLRKVFVVLCEGEAERHIFRFLQHSYANKKTGFKLPQDLHGVRSFDDFTQKYDSCLKGLKQKYGRDIKNIALLFMIDYDLSDSKKIIDFIESKGHLAQVCDPNTEGMIMSMIGKPVKKEVGVADYRTKCKNVFKAHFGCTVDKLTEKQLREVFSTIEIVQKHLPTLHALFLKYLVSLLRASPYKTRYHTQYGTSHNSLPQQNSPHIPPSLSR
jgi:hypothetical protein